MPTWGAAATAGPDAAVSVAAPQPSAEEAKRAWLAKQDVPRWGKPSSAAAAPAAAPVPAPAPAPVPVQAAAPAAPQPSAEEAKRAWLAKLDRPTWGKAAKVLAGVMSEALDIAALAEKCDSGDDTACDSLSSEEEAKKAWLAKLDVPTWGKVSAAVSATAMTTFAATVTVDEAAAKRAWLAKLDAPTWGRAAAALSSAATDAATYVDLTERCDEGDYAACDTLSREDEAKKAWLAKLDAPSWGAAATVVADIADATSKL